MKTKKNRNTSNNKPRTRVRTVDFMRIEGTVNNQPLSTFELDVREKLAVSASPLNFMIQQEDEALRDEQRHEAKQTLKELLKAAHLTRKQLWCYRLVFREGRTIRDTALLMKVSDARICTMVEGIKTTLKRTAAKLENGQMLFERISEMPLEAWEKQLCDLRLRKGLSLRRIAAVMGISWPTVHRRVKAILGRLVVEE
ncbi:MAG: hypothetical protein Q8P24_16530 [Desulfobacterales bacterium]|nr:hypothetical protein [Desulfobacterales bacterium]